LFKIKQARFILPFLPRVAMASSALAKLYRVIDHNDEFFFNYYIPSKADPIQCRSDFSAMMRRHGHTYEPLITAASDCFAVTLPEIIATGNSTSFSIITTIILAICLSAIGAPDEHAAIVTRTLLSTKLACQ
jgi:hypothetical protein